MSEADDKRRAAIAALLAADPEQLRREMREETRREHPEMTDEQIESSMEFALNLFGL